MKKTFLAFALVAGLTSFAGNAKADFNYSFTPVYAIGTGWNILSPVTGTIFGSLNADGTSFNLTGISASNGIYSSLFDNVTYNNLSIISGIIKGIAQADNSIPTIAGIVVDFGGGPYAYQSLYIPTSYDGVRAGNGVSAATVSNVPEPSTYALFGLGALALVVAYRRKVA
jgi:hypothetical protein